MKNNTLHKWLQENLWAILIVVAGTIITFAIMQQRIATLEAKVIEYPSQDWFELKFDNIERRFVKIEELVK